MRIVVFIAIMLLLIAAEVLHNMPDADEPDKASLSDVQQSLEHLNDAPQNK